MSDWQYKNLKISEVPYGFGWIEENNASTEPLHAVLAHLDEKFEKLEAENKRLKEIIKKDELC